MEYLDKELIIHVGMPKTGTTSLQKILWSNRDRLLDEEGICYPNRWLNSEGIAHHELALSFERGCADIDKVFLEVCELFNEEKVSKILISSESFTNSMSGKSFDLFHKFLDKVSSVCNVRVVIVLREYASFVESMYLQEIKVGEIKNDFSVYLEERYTWCDRLFERLAFLRSDFSRVNVDIIPYDGSSVIAKFFSLLNIPLVREGEVNRLNQKLSFKAQNFLFKALENTNCSAVNRSEFVKGFENGALKFENDIFKYTLYSKNEQLLLSELSRQYAIRHGIHEYLETSHGYEKYCDGKESVVLEESNLTDAEVDALNSQLDSIRVNRP